LQKKKSQGEAAKIANADEGETNSIEVQNVLATETQGSDMVGEGGDLLRGLNEGGGANTRIKSGGKNAEGGGMAAETL